MPKITVGCFGVIANSKKAKSLWEDVWLTWNKPNRKGRKDRVHIGPCLCSLTDLKNDEIFVSKNSKQEIYDNLSVYDYYVCNPESDIPDIYTIKEYIDRQEAENMIVYLLTNCYGMNGNNIWFKWKRTNLTVISV